MRSPRTVSTGRWSARVLEMVRRAEYKRRQAPPGVRISGRAFGRDWRYPITSGYRHKVLQPDRALQAVALKPLPTRTCTRAFCSSLTTCRERVRVVAGEHLSDVVGLVAHAEFP